MTVASNSPTPVARAEPLNQHMTCATFDKRNVPVGAPLYTTPARAEAQDEGAAAIVDRLVDNIACATQNRALLVGDPAEDKALTEAIRDNTLQEIERLLNRAHPSPTPAADADRAREALSEVRDWLALLAIASVDDVMQGATAMFDLCDAALKSEGK